MGKTPDIHKNDFLNLFKFLPDAIVVANREGTIVLINPVTEEIFGYSQEELLGEPVEVLIPERFHKGHSKHRENYYKKPKAKLMGLDIGIVGRCKDGSEVPLDISLSPWGNGDESLVLCLIRDITEGSQMVEALRQSEERHRILFDQSPLGVYIFDKELRITRCNRRLAEILQSSEDKIVGLDTKKLKDRNFIPAMEETLKGESSYHEGFYRATTSSANLWLSLYSSPLRDSEGSVIEGMGVVEDITDRKQAEEEVNRKNKKIQILNTVTQAVHKSQSLEEIYTIALDMATELENVDMTLIYLVDKDRKEAIVQAHRNLPEDYIRRARIIPSPKGATWRVINTGKIDNIANVQKDVNVGPAGRELGHHGALGTPITSEEEVIGVIWFLSYKEREFDESEVGLLTSIGDQIATAISKAKLYKDLARKSRHEEIIRTVTQIVHSSIDLQEVLDNAVGSMSENIDSVNVAGIYMVEGEEAVLKAYRGLSAAYIERATIVPYPKGLTWKTILEGKPRYCADADEDEYLGPAGKKEGIKSYLSMPIAYEGKTVGCIHITSKQKNAIDEQELQLLEIVSHQISIAVKNAQQAAALLFTQFSVDRFGVAAFWIDPDARFLYVNEAACNLLGYSSEELRSMSVHAVDPSFSEETWPETWGKFKQRGTLTFETQVQRKDARIIAVEVTVNYLDYKGKEYICAFVRDITEQKRIEEELVKAQKLESIGILAGGIAHDFNNLLTGIMGNISLARLRMEEDSPICEMLQEAENASIRAASLTNQLLTFSKGGEPVKELASIAELIKEAAGFSTRGSNVRCEYSISPDLWSAEVDKGQLSQVINNLIINAQQAMPEGGIVKLSAANITVEKEHDVLRGGNYVQISVEDEGTGIPKEYLQRIFDPYFTTKQKGSGLGLATSYSIISKHGGLLTVDSEMGAGTTFTIYIPASEQVNRRDKEGERGVLEGGEGRVLVMDDDEIIRDVAEMILEDIGYDFQLAGDGAEAVELYKEALEGEHSFDAVILDLTVPGGMGGKETMENLIRIDPNVRAIVSSGYSNDPVMADFEKYGFKGIVAKPYNAQELSRILHRIICPEP